MTFRLTSRQEEAQQVLGGPHTHCMLYGGGRCIGANTVIDGQEQTIKRLAEAGLPVVVQTTRGPMLADAPFLKGRAALLRFVLESGESVEVTADHRFWNGDQWIKAHRLRVGDVLAVQSFPCPPVSSSAFCQQGLSEDALHSTGTLAGLPERCSVYSHQCDPLPRLEEVGVQAPCASLCDVSAHTRCDVLSPMLGLDNRTGHERAPGAIHSLSDHTSSRRSKMDEHLLKAVDQPAPQCCVSQRTCGLFPRLLQAVGRWLRPSILPEVARLLVDSVLFQFALFFGCSFDRPRAGGYVLRKVSAVTATSVQPYYTMQVPVTEQYFANGILHHNSGKSLLIVRGIVLRALKAPGSRHLVTRQHFNHCKQSIVLDTFPKVMSTIFPEVEYHINKTDWYATLGNTGSEIWFGGLDDGVAMEKVLGKEYATVFMNEASQSQWAGYMLLMTRLAQNIEQAIGNERSRLKLRMWSDCNPPSKAHWSYKVFKKKINPDSGNPLPNAGDFTSFQMNPAHNLENLSPEYVTILQSMSGRMLRRFEHGEWAEATPNALFDEAVIDEYRIIDGKLPDMVRIVIGIDPSGAEDDADEDNLEHDEIGIAVAGLGTDGKAYIIEDLTVGAGPSTWGRVAVDAYSRHKADKIVAESNFGGGMVQFVIRTAAHNRQTQVNQGLVVASRGKVVRAEPFSALYEDGKICHVGYLSKLEDELCNFSTSGYIGPRSPNRADAVIWCLAELFPALVAPPKVLRPKREKVQFGPGSWLG